jgi:hypothetical protein
MKKKEDDEGVLDVLNKKLTAKEKKELAEFIEAYSQKIKKQGKKDTIGQAIISFCKKLVP